MDVFAEEDLLGRNGLDFHPFLTPTSIIPTRYSFARNILVSMVSKMG